MMDKLPFSNDSVKEDNEPREPWVQEGITKFSPVKDKEIVERVREDTIDILFQHLKGYYERLGYPLPQKDKYPEDNLVDKILSHKNIKIARDDGTVIEDE